MGWKAAEDDTPAVAELRSCGRAADAGWHRHPSTPWGRPALRFVSPRLSGGSDLWLREADTHLFRTTLGVWSRDGKTPVKLVQIFLFFRQSLSPSCTFGACRLQPGVTAREAGRTRTETATSPLLPSNREDDNPLPRDHQRRPPSTPGGCPLPRVTSPRFGGGVWP
eukprot:TRINITY_DN1215_c0_g1_i7.p1 TRINITY_DN1215_c0_g1~~TRINITY_DN1215_c0_g1_i7.p1  ORF type:complete len:166 (+),score=7.01 TRINITY_DN1215_c0_g1_i7:1265-1762(+)